MARRDPRNDPLAVFVVDLQGILCQECLDLVRTGHIGICQYRSCLRSAHHELATLRGVDLVDRPAGSEDLIGSMIYLSSINQWRLLQI